MKRLYSCLSCFSVYTFFLLCAQPLIAEEPPADSISTDTVYTDFNDILYADKILPDIPLFPFEQIPDSAEIRKAIATTWLSAPIESLVGSTAQEYVDSKGNTFRIDGKYADDAKTHYAISITPVLMNYALPEKRLVVPGTWIIYREVRTGIPSLITIYPRENPALSIRLKASDQKSRAKQSVIDVCLLNAYVRKGVYIALPFEKLHTISLSELQRLTSNTVPWDLFNSPVFLNTAEPMAKVIWQRMGRLTYLENGCFDENGKPVYIDTLGPQTDSAIYASLQINQQRASVVGGVDDAGFAKWLIDGIIKPIAGQGMLIQSLKLMTDVPFTHFTATFLEEKRPFFRLNWIRNLGAAALSLNLKRTVCPAQSGLDVTLSPFATTHAVPKVFSKENTAASAFLGYEKYAGYQVEYLEALLYYLTIMEPGHFYLGCLNKKETSAAIRDYYKILVFLPYFDAQGNFHTEVFTGGEYLSLEDFVTKHRDSFIALVRVFIPEASVFNP
ncbi:MAG: hypothetical protein ACTTJ7_05985 [Treponema sp.]